VFFGTPVWACPSLHALLASSWEVAMVVTNPDRPAGRGRRARPSPVKAKALAAGVELLQPSGGRDPYLRRALLEAAPEVCVVVAYGSLLPSELLAIPRLGFVNLHFSLLPAFRGAAPVQWALISGATATGVSVMVLSEGLDEGPLLAAESTPIAEDDTAGTLGDRLAHLGAPLLVRSLERYARGAIEPQPQDHARATYAPKLGTEDARLDWTRPAAQLRDLVRACNPEPGAWTLVRGARLKVLAAHPAPERGHARLAPGEIDAAEGLVVGAADGALVLAEVQLAGRRRMPGVEAARGLRLRPGERMG
jgi:methionyl-tRNA formyltransferase